MKTRIKYLSLFLSIIMLAIVVGSCYSRRNNGGYPHRNRRRHKCPCFSEIKHPQAKPISTIRRQDTLLIGRK